MKFGRNRCGLILVGIVVQWIGVGSARADWPQFRGPDGSGVVESERPPVQIGPATNVKWKVAVPPGASSPVIVGNLVVFTGFENNKLWILAYHRTDGKEAWRAEAPYERLESFHATEGSPAASSCATDGAQIVSYFGSSGLYCHDLNGKELWKRPLPVAATMGDFGTGTSPIVAEGIVILQRDLVNESRLLAVDINSGDVKWEAARSSLAGFGSPVIWKTQGGTQVVAAGMGNLISYDLHTGVEKWRVNGMPATGCTTPVVQGDRLFYAGWSPGDPTDTDGFKMPTFDEMLAADTNKNGELSKEESATTPFKDFFDNNDTNKDGRITREEWNAMIDFLASSRNSAFAVRAGGSGDISSSHVLWRQTTGLPYVPSAILYRGRFILVKDGGIVTVYDAAGGEKQLQQRLVASGEYYASPVAANGHVYFASLKDGVVTVVRADGETLAAVHQSDSFQERITATPAIADNTLYLRTAGHLYAFGE